MLKISHKRQHRKDSYKSEFFGLVHNTRALGDSRVHSGPLVSARVALQRPLLLGVLAVGALGGRAGLALAVRRALCLALDLALGLALRLALGLLLGLRADSASDERVCTFA